MPSRRSFIGAAAAAAAGFPFWHRHGWAPTGGDNTTTAAPAPVPATAVVPTGSSSAGSMPTGAVVSNNTTWTPVYAEDFLLDAAQGSVPSTYSTMGFYEGFRDTSGYGLYEPDLVLSAEDSLLDFHLRTVNGQPVVASILPDNYAPHDSARVSVRYRADPITGYKFVGMLWPVSDNWNEGEIDWPEGNLDGLVRPASAIAGTLGRGKSGNPIFLPDIELFSPTGQTDFHVATTEWTPSAVRFYWDDILIAEVTEGVPTAPLRVTLQAETWINAGPPAPWADGHLEIDWIVIYEPQ